MTRESMLLDDLRWTLGAVEQIPGPECHQLAEQLRRVLADWTAVPGTFSDNTVVAADTEYNNHLYAPPHRRGTTTEKGI